MAIHLSGPVSPALAYSVAFVDASWLRSRGSGRGHAAVGFDVDPLHFWLETVRWRHYPHMRTYVYEGQYETGPNVAAQQAYLDKIAEVPGVQVRTGTLVERVTAGQAVVQQKGVDALLVLDMLTLAIEGVYQVGILISGDRDFAGVVREVQRRGKFVIQCGPEDGNGVARELRQIADDFLTIPENILNQTFAANIPPRTSGK